MPIQNKMNIVIHGYYGASNYGDDIILLSMINSLREIEPDIDITVLSRNISPIPGNNSFHVVSRFDIRNTASIIKEADLFICGGGGILQDYSGFVFDDHFGARTRGLDFYALPVEMAYLMGKPLMLYAIGVGPLFNKMSRRYVKTILNWADIITVRDQPSADLIKSINPDVKPVVTADPAVNFIKRPLARFQKEPGKKYAGICLRSWFMKDHELESFIRNMAATADYLADRHGYNVVLFPFNKSTSDLKLLTKVYQSIKNKYSASLYEKMSMDETIGVLSQMDFVIGMRLHSVIMSTSNYVPAIAVSYDDKVSNYMRLLGMEKYILSLEKIYTRSPKEILDDIITNKTRLESKLKEIILTLKDQEKENATLAINLLRKGR